MLCNLWREGGRHEEKEEEDEEGEEEEEKAERVGHKAQNEEEMGMEWCG